MKITEPVHQVILNEYDYKCLVEATNKLWDLQDYAVSDAPDEEKAAYLLSHLKRLQEEFKVQSWKNFQK